MIWLISVILAINPLTVKSEHDGIDTYKKINQFYTSSNYSLDLEYLFFESENNPIPNETQYQKVIKYDSNFYYQINDLELLNWGDYSLIIDHDAQIIVYDEPEEKKTKSKTKKKNQLTFLFDSITFQLDTIYVEKLDSSFSNLFIKYSNHNMLESCVFTFHNSRFFIKSIDYSFISSDKDFGGKKISINFSEPKVLGKNELDKVNKNNYIIINQSKINGVGKLSNYEIISKYSGL